MSGHAQVFTSPWKRKQAVVHRESPSSWRKLKTLASPRHIAAGDSSLGVVSAGRVQDEEYGKEEKVDVDVIVEARGSFFFVKGWSGEGFQAGNKLS